MPDNSPARCHLPAQLIELGNFGFQLLRDTIASYQNVTVAPANDEEKRAMWVTRQSRIAGYNFAPYYMYWGWPLSQATSDALSDLPTFTVPVNLASPPLPPFPPKPPRPPRPPFNAPSRCADQATLTANVTWLDTPMWTSWMIMWGDAIPLLAEGDGNMYFAAATRYGSGTAVAFGHEAMMSSDSHNGFMKNVALWSAGLGASDAGPKTLCYPETGYPKQVAARLAAMVSHASGTFPRSTVLQVLSQEAISTKVLSLTASGCM